MNKLNKLYKAILEALGCVIKDDYSIVMSKLGQEFPVKVDDKQVYLPVNEALEEVCYDRAFFHPACESIASKETEMDKVLRKLISSALYFNFRPIADVLFKVAASKSSKSLSPKLLEELEPLRGVNKKVIGEVVDIIKRISITMEAESVDTRILSMTLKRGGKTENDEHIFYRCTPQFPFYRELKRLVNQNTRLKDTPDQPIVFNGNSYSYRAACCVCVIFELTIPSVKDPSRLESINTNQTAARMTSMLRTFGLIADEINTIIGKFRKEFDEIGIYGFELDWIENLDELPDIAQLVPALEYNNYNTKPEAPEIDPQLNFDPFNVSKVDDPFETKQSVSSRQPQPTQEGKIRPPRPRDGEAYLGMKTHENGVLEYRFRNGSELRIVCLSDNGTMLSERFVSEYQQPEERRRRTSGWEDESDYQVLSNGVRVPILSSGRRRYYDDYDDRYYDDRRYRHDDRDDRHYRERDWRDRPRTGWGEPRQSDSSYSNSGCFDYNSNY